MLELLPCCAPGYAACRESCGRRPSTATPNVSAQHFALYCLCQALKQRTRWRRRRCCRSAQRLCSRAPTAPVAATGPWTRCQSQPCRPGGWQNAGWLCQSLACTRPFSSWAPVACSACKVSLVVPQRTKGLPQCIAAPSAVLQDSVLSLCRNKARDVQMLMDCMRA